MIRYLVNFALKNPFVVLGIAVFLFVWGIISFKALPIDAYPDIANNYVNVITQWPGHSAEDIEKQVTVPTEIQMAGLPHLDDLRSFTLAGISSLMMNFDDASDNNWNRERVVERLGMVTLPNNLVPQLQTDWSPTGQIYFYTMESKNPSVDVMELKSIADWTLGKQFKSVPHIVDVATCGGLTKEYQIRLDPEKLISYGLSLSQVENQLSLNNTNAGGSFIQVGPQQINVHAQGLFTTVQDIKNTVVAQSNGAPIRIKDIAEVDQGPKIRLGYPDLAIGAGTVLDEESARRSIEAGARFLTSPGFVPEVVAYAKKSDVVVFPGALTPTEVTAAWKAGSDFVKIYPSAPMGGVQYVRALKVPLPQIPLIATGGVNQSTAFEFILAGVSAIGVGTELLPKEALQFRQEHRVHELARRFIAMVKEAREQRESI